MTSEVRAFEPTSHLGVKMNKTSKSLRLTDRDVEYITWIAEQQAVRLDTLQLLFEIKGRKIDYLSINGVIRVPVNMVKYSKELSILNDVEKEKRGVAYENAIQYLHLHAFDKPDY